MWGAGSNCRMKQLLWPMNEGEKENGKSTIVPPKTIRSPSYVSSSVSQNPKEKPHISALFFE